MSASGRCACGSVRYHVDDELRAVSNCHCEPCRRTSGHHLAATAADPSRVTVEPNDTLTWWSRTGEVQYGFCSGCGSTLFWKANDKSLLAITAGTLDHPTGLTTNSALFVSEHGDYFEPTTVEQSFPLDRG